MTRIFILNGPNPNFLSCRNPGVYGSRTLEEIKWEIINCIQENWVSIDGIFINPGALTTSGYSLEGVLNEDAVAMVQVHLSNTHSRGEWRRHVDIVSLMLL